MEDIYAPMCDLRVVVYSSNPRICMYEELHKTTSNRMHVCMYLSITPHSYFYICMKLFQARGSCVYIDNIRTSKRIRNIQCIMQAYRGRRDLSFVRGLGHYR